MAKAPTYTIEQVKAILAGQPLPAEPIISNATAPATGSGNSFLIPPGVASNLPPWVLEAQAAALKSASAYKQAPAKAPASTVKPHHVASPGSYTPDKGANAGIPILGLRVVKMFGDQPNKLSKFGKFLTFGEAQAVYTFVKANGGN
jgi:hypothetical protein